MATYSVFSVTSDKTTLPDDGSLTATVTAVIQDDAGAPAPADTTVTWALSPAAAGTITPASSVTDDSGTATAAVTATAADMLQVTATTDDDTTGKSVSITAVATYSVFSVTSDKTTLPDDGSLAATVTAVIHDDAGAPAPAGTTVIWALSPAASGTVTPASSVTDGSGTATAAVTATAADMLQVTATTADDTTGKKAGIYASTPLPAPVVSGASLADQYTVDYYDLQLGVQMTIPHYPNAAAGDTVTFYWGDYSHPYTLTDPAAQLPMVIDISTELPPAYLEDGSYAVYYTASDAAGNVAYSSALPLIIANGGQTTPTLTKPSIPVAADGYINIVDASSDVEVDITYPSMAAGDYIMLYWPAVDTGGNPIQAASTSLPYTVKDGETSCVIMVPDVLFFPGGTGGYQGTVGAYYTVLAAGTSRQELSYTQTVTVDTVPPGIRA